MTRFVSVGNARKLMFGGGWGSAAFMMMFAFLISRHTECGIPMYDRQTTATVTHTEKTSSEENDKTIYRIDYTFHDSRGALHEGTSYSPTELAGEQPVFYINHDPDESRLVEARTQQFGTLGFVLTLLVYFIGLGTAMKALANGGRWVTLLRRGTEVTGRETEREHIPGDSDSPDKWRISFAYERDGRPLTYTLITTNKDFPSEVRILYEGALVTTIEEIPVDLTKEPSYSAHLLVLPLATLGFAIATIIAAVVQ